MTNPFRLFYFSISLILFLLLTSCGGGPPKPGREISIPEVGLTIKVAEGWECEVTGVDWTTWQRVQKGRADDPWVIPPVTCRDIETGGQGPNALRYMNWRFKGVEGVFDPTVDPLTSQYPVPPGLWALDPMKLELLETQKRQLPWPGLLSVAPGVEATCRLYENTHGMGASSALWHTYVVTFVVEGNTYEFVMSLPDYVDHRDYMDKFWLSIEDLSL